MMRFIAFPTQAQPGPNATKHSVQGGRGGRTQPPSQDYKEKKPDVVKPPLKEISYVYFSATKDGDTCDVCKALDGSHLLPNHKMLHDIKPPHAGCKSPEGCRCTLVYVTRDEEGSREIESLLKRCGGMCDRQAIERGLT